MQTTGNNIFRRPEILLLLMSVAVPLSFAAWRTLLNNFAIERATFSGQEMGIKSNRVVVTIVEGEPGDRSTHLAEPVTQQRRFAIAGRGRGQGQPLAQVQSLIQSPDQARARDDA